MEHRPDGADVRSPFLPMVLLALTLFTVLPVDFTEAQGHLTPSMKLKRAAIAREFGGEIEKLYAKPSPGSVPA